jgi:hypothetical protein
MTEKVLLNSSNNRLKVVDLGPSRWARMIVGYGTVSCFAIQCYESHIENQTSY